MSVLDDIADPVLTITFRVNRNGDIANDTLTHDKSFGEMYRAFHHVKKELERQIAERRNCPYNPINEERE